MSGATSMEKASLVSKVQSEWATDKEEEVHLFRTWL
jgi:hypothetical protein